MPNYLREQSTGEIVRNTFQIYRKHFLTVVPIYALINLPTAILMTFVPNRFSWVAYGLDWLIVAPLAVAIISVLLWDVCMGNTPSMSRAIRKVMSAGALWVFVVSLLMVLALSTVLLCFAVPIWVAFAWLISVILVAYAWFMFVVPVVMLEDLSAGRAMQRSRQLGKGHYLRNLGVFLGLYAVVTAINLLIGGVLMVAIGLLRPEASGDQIFKRTVALAKCLTGPIFTITAILIYFDMRARKEAHGFFMMGQDLMR